MHEKPLNRLLYNKLLSSFGEVRVHNAGVAQSVNYSFSNLRGSTKDKLQVTEPGEYYVVCCPFCNDRRFRLYINHMFGVREEVTGSKRYHLAICFNEGCISDYEMQQLLLQRIDATPDELERCGNQILTGKTYCAEAETAVLPGRVIPLDQLPYDHLAIRYLVSRHFDPGYLAKFYNVGWCDQGLYQLASGRIIIPVFYKGKLRGWQARFPGELNWKRKGSPPKYFTMPGMPRRKILYNFGRAVQYKTGVLVEGVSDVWAFGPMAMCSFGDTLTNDQRDLLVQSFRGRPLVLLYDPEAMIKDSVKETLDRLRIATENNCAGVTLPEGTDPGSLNRDFLRTFVAREAARQGVIVSWQRESGAGSPSPAS
jgi:hypothetical protein